MGKLRKLMKKAIEKVVDPMFSDGFTLNGVRFSGVVGAPESRVSDDVMDGDSESWVMGRVSALKPQFDTLTGFYINQGSVSIGDPNSRILDQNKIVFDGDPVEWEVIDVVSRGFYFVFNLRVLKTDNFHDVYLDNRPAKALVEDHTIETGLVRGGLKKEADATFKFSRLAVGSVRSGTQVMWQDETYEIFAVDPNPNKPLIECKAVLLSF